MTSERRWWNTAGAWLAIGTGPAALVLGAGLADRHDGPVPVGALLAGGVAMTVLLLVQGRLGLRPPDGEGRPLAAVLEAYLPRGDRLLVGTLMALAMAGWLGFNAALGGSALASLLGAPTWVGVAALGLPLLALAAGGLHRWNAIALVTTAAALALIVVIATHGDGSTAGAPPLAAGAGAPSAFLTDVAVFVGYVAVFALRAPDFTAGLRGRGDLWACAAILVLPTLVAAAAGTTIALRSDSADLVGHLRTSDLGTALVVVAVAAPCLTAFHSGGLALRSVVPARRDSARLGGAAHPTGGHRHRLSHRLAPLPHWAATAVIGVAGLALATTGFENALLPWLTMLAAVLPPLVVPLGWEARARRRQRRPPRAVHALMWLPAAALGVALTIAGVPGAPLAGLAAAVIGTAGMHGFHRIRSRR
ncbi:hypothetical protein E1212_28375 [Jiangella ureilytica]|uniref:Amino acid permease n=1 Tax=Jiangella ureilytica TaxID=2530374 RepID=A0A4R4R9Q6_9ACTN|nr:hypothetical protein [Jiangella ureilytica]TDC45746.1 hypothetical protein E1212_28375 [Jiangella ureilytica]